MHQSQIEEQTFPKYLERFSQFCALLDEQHFAQINIAIWQFAIFTHLVQKKQFLSALPYLKWANQALQGQDQSMNKLARLTSSVEKQYEQFLIKKNLTITQASA